eukprot:8757562-Pyramimonas_sp.AAC.1
MFAVSFMTGVEMIRIRGSTPSEESVVTGLKSTRAAMFTSRAVRAPLQRAKSAADPVVKPAGGGEGGQKGVWSEE